MRKLPRDTAKCTKSLAKKSRFGIFLKTGYSPILITYSKQEAEDIIGTRYSKQYVVREIYD